MAKAAAEAFDLAFARVAPELTMRPESDTDERFLYNLFAACSPFGDMLPPSIIEQQARGQLAGHRAQHPLAMRRIVSAGRTPVGRIAIDWSEADRAHCIDVAVLPAARRSTRAGRYMLNAWLEVADAAGRVCTLQVLAANPARQIYAKLGFVDDDGQAPDAPSLAMSRPLALTAERSENLTQSPPP